MKRIVFLVTNDLNYDQRMQRICGELANSGFKCLLVGRRRRSSTSLSEQRYSQKRLFCFFEKGKLFYLEYNLRLIFYLLFKQLDGICSIDADTAIPGFLVSRLRRKKFIFDAHELFPEVPEVIHRPLVKKIWERVEWLAFRNADLAYTVGEALAEYFENRYGRKVYVIRNVPGKNKRFTYQPDTRKFILYQGALNRGRGLENLIRAMKSLPCQLVLAGDGGLTMELMELAQKEGVTEKVMFTGYLSPGELRMLTVRAWIGYNVSENMGMSYYLSLNNKFFDYIHAGLPSLINDFPEYRKLNLQFHVGVVTQSDVEDIVKKATLLLNDENLHEELSRNCHDASEILCWESEKTILIDLYRKYFEK